MNQSLTILFFIFSISLSGQTDYNNIINNWIEGRIDTSGKVIKAEVNRGGWYSLNFINNKDLIFQNPFTCGFGHERIGQWKLIEKDTSIICTFYKINGYLNNRDTSTIDQTEIYKIIKLNSEELILTGIVEGRQRVLPFIKYSKD